MKVLCNLLEIQNTYVSDNQKSEKSAHSVKFLGGKNYLILFWMAALHCTFGLIESFWNLFEHELIFSCRFVSGKPQTTIKGGNLKTSLDSELCSSETNYLSFSNFNKMWNWKFKSTRLTSPKGTFRLAMSLNSTQLNILALMLHDLELWW